MMTPEAGCTERWRSRGYLPHFEAGERPQAVTFRLADSLPKEKLLAWEIELATLTPEKASRERRVRIEAYLDAGAGACWLNDPRLARRVQEALLYFDGERYGLHAWVVMPNHVHVVVTPRANWPLHAIVHSWKSFTARQANELQGRRGPFWQREYHDRLIRDERHFGAAVEYVHQNPVKANLCAFPEDWPYGSAAGSAGILPAL